MSYILKGRRNIRRPTWKYYKHYKNLMGPHFALMIALFFISIIRIGCQVYHDPLPDLLGTENFISTLWEEQPLPPDPWDADYITPYTLSDEPVKEEEGIMVLDKDNFDNVIQNTPKIIVVFYSPKCERSKTFMPVYKQIGGEMGTKDSTIKLGKINVDTNGHLLRYGAGDLPLFILFKNQHASPQYQGQKEKDLLVQWIQKEFSQGIESSIGYSPYKRRAPENRNGEDLDGQSTFSVIVDMDESDPRPIGIEPYPREPSPRLSPLTTPTPVPENAVLSQLSPPATTSTPAPTLPSGTASQTSPPAITPNPATTLPSPTTSQTSPIAKTPNPAAPTLPSSAPSQTSPPAKTPTPAPTLLSPTALQTSQTAKTSAPTLPISAASQTSPPANTPAPPPTLLSPTALPTSAPAKTLALTLPSLSASQTRAPAKTLELTVPSSTASQTRQFNSSVRYVERDSSDKRQLDSAVRYVERDSYDKRHLNSPGRYVERDSYDRRSHDYHERGYDREERRGHGHKHHHDHRSDRDSYSRRHGRSDHRHDRASYGRRRVRVYDYPDRR